MFKSFAILSAAVLLTAAARADFKVPSMTGPVVDNAGALSASDAAVLERQIRRAYDAGVVQLQVLIVPDLGGLTTEEAAIKIFDQWKLGEAKKDNGVLFLISFNEHRMRLEVGRGLEGNIPDAIAKRILSDQVAPLMREGRTAEAVQMGIQSVISTAQDPDAAPKPREQQSSGHDIFVVFLLVGFLIFFNLFGRRSGIFLGGGGFGGGGWGGGGGGWSGGGGGSAGGGASSGW